MAWIETPQLSSSVSRAVIETVAEKEGVEPTALSPLYEHVEPEALELVFKQTETGTARKVMIKFVYEGYLITVTVDDGITITLDEYPAN